MGGILVSRVGMTRDDSLLRSPETLLETLSRQWTQERRGRTQDMQIQTVRLTREVARSAVKRRVVRETAESGSPSSVSSEESATEGRPGRETEVRRRGAT